MKTAAKVYIGLVLALGLTTLIIGFAEWQCASALMFTVYLCSALITSGWKVSLPGIHGTLSANFLYVLIGVVELSMGETTVIAVSSALFQYLYRARTGAKLVQAAFNAANIAIAVLFAYGAFHARILDWLSLEFPFRLALAAVVYFLANTVPIATAICLTEDKSLLKTWKDCYFWSLGYYLVGAGCTGVLHMTNKLFGWQSSMLVVPVIYVVYRSYSLYMNRFEKEKAQSEIERGHAEQMASLHLRTIEALALAIEAKDQSTHDHLQRVEIYCMEMASLLNLGEEEKRALQTASLLHDIGKLAVPEHILSKPGKLTPEEFEKVKIHPVVGAEILERVGFPYPVVPIVRCHHERWDGNGYPDGLSGEDIPIGARILAAVDCLDALASERQYRRAFPLDQAMDVVFAESGKTYDPRVVQILKANYVEMERKARNTPGNGNSVRDLRVDRQVVPGAGFESGHDPIQLKSTAFLNTIGAARQEAQLLFEIAQGMVSSLSLSDMLDHLTNRFRTLVHFDSIAVYLTSDQGLENVYVAGDDAPLFRSLHIPLGQGISGWVAENGKPIRNGNPSIEPGYLNDPKVFSIHRSALAVPLEGSSGIMGTLALYDRKKDAFSKDDLRVLLAIASKLGLAIENGLRFREGEDTALTDYLTGLPNARALFHRVREELEKQRAAQGALVILLADLDGFKIINDTYGHLTGNSVLKAVATALLHQCREGDMVARMGGDEFVIVCPNVPPSMAGEFCVRLKSAVETTGLAELGKPLLSVSIGIGVYPEDGSEPDELLAAADRQMYENKELARQRRTGIWALSDAVTTASEPIPEEQPCPAPANS